MPTYRGLPACDCLVKWCAAFEKLIGRAPTLFQLAGDAPASAGFHRGGGSADYEPLSEDELRIARNMGGAAWNRWWSSGYHSHTRLNGCPHNSIAQPQVEDLNEGRDGTGPLYDDAGVPDNGPRDGVQWPLRTWREGIEWAENQGDDMPLDKEDLAKIRGIVKSEVKAGVDPLSDQITRLNRTVRAQVKSVRKKLDEPIDNIEEIKADLDEIAEGLAP